MSYGETDRLQITMLADLHIHSCLSPCASLKMSPRLIASTAAAKGIQLVALTDHNSARNTPAFADACRIAGIYPLFGMEITTVEECHVLAIFDNLENAAKMEGWVAASQSHKPLDLNVFGDQPVVDVDENIVEMVDYYLGAATAHSIESVQQRTHQLGGLFIPSHINRAVFSVESQLGFLPPGDYDAIEVQPRVLEQYRRRYPQLPVITASDAHHPDQIGANPIDLPLTPPVNIDRLRSALADLSADYP